MKYKLNQKVHIAATVIESNEGGVLVQICDAGPRLWLASNFVKAISRKA